MNNTPTVEPRVRIQRVLEKSAGTAGSDPTGSRGKRWNRGFGSNGFSRKTLEPRFGFGSDPNPFALLTPLEKVLLIGCARLWAATATSGTRGACVVSADQAPRRARSMGARGSGIFNGVTQSASLFAFQRPHQRHSWHFNVTLCISEPPVRHSLRFTGLRFARDLLMRVHPRGTSAASGLEITAELIVIDRVTIGRCGTVPASSFFGTCPIVRFYA